MRKYWDKVLTAISSDGKLGWLFYAVFGGMVLMGVVEAFVLTEITKNMVIFPNVMVLFLLVNLHGAGKLQTSMNKLVSSYRGLVDSLNAQVDFYQKIFTEAVEKTEGDDNVKH